MTNASAPQNFTAAALARTATAPADRPFLIWNGATTLTFADLPAAVGRFTAALAALDIEPGDVVLVQAAKCPDFALAYLGVLARGAIFLPLNTGYTREEIAYFLDDAKPRLILCDADNKPLFDALTGEQAADVPVLRLTDADGSLAARAAAITDPLPPVDSERNDGAAILYTSGTTGRPKGALLTHGNLTSNVATLHEHWGFVDGDVLIHVLPVFHAHGLFVALHLALWNASTTHFLPAFNPDAVLDLMADPDHPGTVFMGVPTLYTRLMANPGLTPEHCAHMRLFVSGSAPLLAETFADFETRTGHRILERYGMTEALMICSNGYAREDRVAGTVGPPLPGVRCRLENPAADETGTEIGELAITGPNVFTGYLNKPEANAKSFTRDGWFLTGDLATIDDTGRVSIVGRNKDLIITGGLNVYPKEVETVLNALPWVRESAVIGLPDADFGEAVTAVLELEDGAVVDEAALRAELDAHLARFKHPKATHVIDTLPRNTMGKVQKNVLRDSYTPK